jgi:(p)ppGpp synthase/HD superfamily hydrolase
MLHVEGVSAQIAAVLHDVVEDSDVPIEDLAEEVFSEEVLAAVEAVTKRPGESRIEAAYRAAANSIARVVKLADNADNLDLSRIADPGAKEYARLEQYREVRAILLAGGTSSPEIYSTGRAVEGAEAVKAGASGLPVQG